MQSESKLEWQVSCFRRAGTSLLHEIVLFNYTTSPYYFGTTKKPALDNFVIRILTTFQFIILNNYVRERLNNREVNETMEWCQFRLGVSQDSAKYRPHPNAVMVWTQTRQHRKSHRDSTVTLNLTKTTQVQELPNRKLEWTRQPRPIFYLKKSIQWVLSSWIWPLLEFFWFVTEHQWKNFFFLCEALLT